MPAVEGLDVDFGLFAFAGPDAGAALVVDFEHVFAGALGAIAEDPAEDHGDVGHEVDRVVEDDDMPDRGLVGLSLLLRCGLGDGFLHGNRVVEVRLMSIDSLFTRNLRR